MSVAAIGTLLIGAAAEAAVVLLLFMISELLESDAANLARTRCDNADGSGTGRGTATTRNSTQTSASRQTYASR
jgi:cation transport ATPase